MTHSGAPHPSTRDKQDKQPTPEDGASAGAESRSLLTRENMLVPGHITTLAPKMASGPVPWSRQLKLSQAHPPAAGGQPLPLFEQHHAFLATDQPAIQLANPASQSYGSLCGTFDTQPPPWVGQPLPCTRQHHVNVPVVHKGPGPHRLKSLFPLRSQHLSLPHQGAGNCTQNCTTCGPRRTSSRY